MHPNTLTVAQIGCGAFATSQDLPNYAQSPQVSCKWCCDVSLERAQSLAARFGVPHVTTDVREAMADPEVDFLNIATSHEAHLPLIEQAAATDKLVFCEKPLAMLDAFVQCIIDDTLSPCDEMAGHQSTLLALLAIQSIELRQPLPVLRERWEFTVL